MQMTTLSLAKRKEENVLKTNDTCKKKFKEHIYNLIADGDADLHHDLGQL